MSVLKGRERSNFSGTEIPALSIRKAFAIMLLSLLVIGISVFLVAVNDGHHGLLNIAFECFSAFSTAGFTFGITQDLSTFSKMVLMLTMFIGRVGVLTIFIAFMQQSQQLYYRYPKEDIAF